MRLNPDCIRDILLHFEKITDGFIVYDVDEQNYKKYLDKYSKEEFIYHFRQCLKHGFLDGEDRGTVFYITDISPSGHAFLAEIRLDNNWNKIKEIAKKLGVASLSSLNQVAISYINSKINGIL